MSDAAAAAAYATMAREQMGEAPGGVADRARAAGGASGGGGGGGGRGGQEGPDPNELGKFLDALDHYHPTVRLRGVGLGLMVDGTPACLHTYLFGPDSACFSSVHVYPFPGLFRCPRR